MAQLLFVVLKVVLGVQLGKVLMLLVVLCVLWVLLVQMDVVLWFRLDLNIIPVRWIHLELLLFFGVLVLILLDLVLILLFGVFLEVHLGVELLLLLALDLIVDLVLDVFPVPSSKDRFQVQTALTDLLPWYRLDQDMDSQLPPDRLLLCRGPRPTSYLPWGGE